MYYTRDGKTKTSFQSLDPVTGEVIEIPIYWGVLYKFKIILDASTYIHSFTVTEYIDEELYLLEHTVCQTSMVSRHLKLFRSVVRLINFTF